MRLQPYLGGLENLGLVRGNNRGRESFLDTTERRDWVTRVTPPSDGLRIGDNSGNSGQCPTGAAFRKCRVGPTNDQTRWNGIDSAIARSKASGLRLPTPFLRPLTI